MTSANLTEPVLVPLSDGTAIAVRGDYGSVRLLIGSEPALSWAEWEQLDLAATRLYAGQRGRKAAGLAQEAGTRIPADFAADVAGTFPSTAEAPPLEAMTDWDWARVARVLRSLGGSFPTLRAFWESAEEDASRG
jgi:hypothetical protein